MVPKHQLTGQRKGRPARPVVHLPQVWSKCQLMVVQIPDPATLGLGFLGDSVRFCPPSANWLPHPRWKPAFASQIPDCWGPRRAGNWFQKHRTRCLELSACCSSMLTVEGSVLPAAPIAARPRQLRVATWRDSNADSNALSATVVRLQLPARKLVWNRGTYACWLLLISGLGVRFPRDAPSERQFHPSTVAIKPALTATADNH